MRSILECYVGDRERQDECTVEFAGDWEGSLDVVDAQISADYHFYSTTTSTTDYYYDYYYDLTQF